MSQRTAKIGVIGCGNISDTYFKVLKRFDVLEVAACSDLDMARARAKAREHAVPRACTVRELLADPEIDLILNLTIPLAHAEVTMAALRAGKHVYTEKPLGISRAEGRSILKLAKQKGLRVGGAPDTFLGGGIQTCRRLIDRGVIGEPVAATAFMQARGHERWHPSPVFYYKPGGGPMFDMGPYYITALVNLLGPVRAVSAEARISYPVRAITSEPLRGKKFRVKTPTHITGVMTFASGALGTMTTSFDVFPGRTPCIEIYGPEGTLSVGDPNSFCDEVWLLRDGRKEWERIPPAFGYQENSRGVGLADMVYALRAGRDHRANERLLYHVVDVMQSFLDSGARGRRVRLQSTVERPAPLPPGLRDGKLDLKLRAMKARQ